MKRFALLFTLFLLPVFALAQVDFEAQVVEDFFDGGLHATAGDLDNDGDMDIAGAAESSDQFAWWEQTDTGWDMHILGTMTWATDVKLVDMSGDGDLDVLCAAGTDDVSWFENDGTGNFTQHIITSFDWTRGIDAWDMDDDGDLDFIVAHSGGMTWLENIGVDQEMWPVHDMFDFDRARGFDMADIDGDGDVDIAVGSASTLVINRVAWYENSNGQWIEHMLDDSHGMAYGVEIVDINGDGALDVLASARSDYITWWENGPWTEEVIVDPFDGARDVYPADIDMDGDMDVVGAAADGDEIAWFEQTDTGWIQHTIDNTRDYAAGVHVADMDDDGDPDVIGVWYYSDQVVVYEQLGTPEPDPVEFDVTPMTTVVPPGGGMVTYGVHLQSNLGITVPGLRYWTMVTIPNGQNFGPLMQVPFTLVPFMDIEVTNMTQQVPGFAPSGNYTHTSYVGVMNNPDLQLSDSFVFVKEGTAAGAVTFDPSQWPAGGTLIASDEPAAASAPTEFALSEAFPNPFNPTTQVSVSLPKTSELTVAVYDVMGRQVAELADGTVSAGVHTFNFDGSSLASGVYFVQATVPGQFEQIRKITLMK